MTMIGTATHCKHQVTKTVTVGAGQTSVLTMNCPFDAVPGTDFCPRHQRHG